MIIKLTDAKKHTPVLIGTENIIQMYTTTITPYDGEKYTCTKIESLGAMVSTNWVEETIEEIWGMINENKYCQ